MCDVTFRDKLRPPAVNKLYGHRVPSFNYDFFVFIYLFLAAFADLLLININILIMSGQLFVLLSLEHVHTLLL